LADGRTGTALIASFADRSPGRHVADMVEGLGPHGP
jgi:hypothetical protein